MITLSRTPYTQTEKALSRMTNIASHYGFSPITEILPNYPLHRTKRVPTLSQLQSFNPIDAELGRMMYSYIEHGREEIDEPTLFYHRVAPQQKDGNVLFGLHVFGSTQSISEALLIRTALAMLDDLGIANRHIRVNSIGDRDSANRFTKELAAYLRKHINDLPGYCRQGMKKDILYAYNQLAERDHQLCSTAPCTVEFLTEHSRQHLREVLECLDRTNISYELTPTLIGNRDCYSKTLFEIHSEPKDGVVDVELFARGGRYDELSKRLFKKTVPAVSLIFEYEKKGRILKKQPIKRKQKPKLYFIQLGFEAQLRSLDIMELLRTARIPVYHSLGQTQLSAQLEKAVALAVPYAMIMGHKEALENVVIVRNLDSRSQEIVSIDTLPTYLKTIL